MPKSVLLQRNSNFHCHTAKAELNWSVSIGISTCEWPSVILKYWNAQGRPHVLMFITFCSLQESLVWHMEQQPSCSSNTRSWCRHHVGMCLCTSCMRRIRDPNTDTLNTLSLWLPSKNSVYRMLWNDQVAVPRFGCFYGDSGIRIWPADIKCNILVK